MELADTAAGTSTPAQRQAAAGDLPAGLADMFVKIKPAERVFLAKLLKQLDEELLYDKYNPKLYYL
jgi:hypothetical protein